MDISTLIANLATSQRTEGWPLDWSTKLQSAAETSHGDWVLSRRDVPPSTLLDSTPGDDLVAWVRAYARHGSPIDPIRIRCKVGGKDKHNFAIHVQPEPEETGQDRALEWVMRIAGDPTLQHNIINMLTTALKPLAESLIKPVVHSSLRELLLQDDLEDSTTEECTTSPHPDPSMPQSRTH